MTVAQPAKVAVPVTQNQKGEKKKKKKSPLTLIFNPLYQSVVVIFCQVPVRCRARIFFVQLRESGIDQTVLIW